MKKNPIAKKNASFKAVKRFFFKGCYFNLLVSESGKMM
jgi:hypothetical protein